MKITLLSILTLIFFTSCSKQPKCEDEESIYLAKELIIQEIKASIGTSYNMLGINIDDALEKFVDENIEIVNARTNNKNEDLKKCDCSSQISFKYSDEFIQKLQEKEKETFMNGVLTTMMTKQINYNYTLQIISKNEKLFVEGIIPVKEINEVFITYIMAYTEFNKNEDLDRDNVVQDKKEMATETSKSDNTVSQIENPKENLSLESSDNNDTQEPIENYETSRTQEEIAIDLLKKGKSIQEVANATSLSKSDVRKIRRKIENN
jgi:hypothetical protein